MTTGLDIARVAAIVGEPARANMLAALLDGRALTALELAGIAGVAPPTASGHLGKLVEARLLACAAQGRHRYFRLASAEVARMLESLMQVAGRAETLRRATPRIAPELREARTCYDHLAGRLAVSVADALVARGAIVLGEEAGEVTETGRVLLEKLGVAMAPHRKTRRAYCRPCLDWSERRPHLGGQVGAALFERALALDWVRRAKSGRAILVTPKGRLGFAEAFDLPLG